MTMRLLSMNASAGAGGTTNLRVKGGDKIRRFVFRASNQSLVTRLAAQSMKIRLLPKLKAAMPRRTGAMVKSLEIRQGSGGQIELWGRFYSRFVTAKGGGSPILIPKVMDILEDERRNIGRDVLRGLLA